MTGVQACALPIFLKEIETLTGKGIDVSPEKLMISERAQVIMPYHKQVDMGRERMKGEQKIGTTGRGIGPAYEDKATRRGIRFVDLMDPEVFADRVRTILHEKNFYLENYLSSEPMDEKPILESYTGFAGKLAPYITNVSLQIDTAVKAGKQVLFEEIGRAHV